MTDVTNRRGLISRLLKDTTANTLAISAAAVVPLIGVIGGGVDASRMYMAKSRLQQACDSATLAARKKLGANEVSGGTIPAEIKTTADNFFENNFQTGTYGTSDTSYTLTSSVGTRMDGTATTKIPTTLMAVFGVDEVDIDVECSADLNLPNIDIVLVLDNSGSMRNSRIAALRTAVFGFYDEIMATKPADARVRIGILPYNASVNVGDMVMAQNANYISDSFTYQSREALFKQISNNDGVDIGDILEEENTVELLPRNSVQLSSTNDAHYHWNENNNKKKQECQGYSGTYTVGEWTWYVTGPTWIDDYWTWNPKKKKAACRANIRKVRIAEEGDVRPPTYRDVFDKYRYAAMTFDTSSFKYGNTVGTPTGTRGATVNSSWNGCIEEATTVATTSFDPIPSGAYDLDIDLVPDASDPDTQWRPMWPAITYDRGGPAELLSTDNKSTRDYSCPVAAHKLQEWPLSGGSRNAAFESAINGMQTHGFTMHNIGMVWAGRMISPDGIFASDNAAAPNGEPISRHVIFMTDGNTEISPSRTDSYGNYDMDGRLAGFAADGTWSSADLRVIHNARLDATCEQVKNKNVTIWTVTFGLPQNTHTKACASGDSRALESDNSAELIANFKAIATNIAELRLVK